MSMSIPFFFQPIELELLISDDGTPLKRPVRSTIVDGGTVSNFPVWLFDSPSPTRPTFGFTLTGGSRCPPRRRTRMARRRGVREPWCLCRLGLDQGGQTLEEALDRF